MGMHTVLAAYFVILAASVLASCVAVHISSAAPTSNGIDGHGIESEAGNEVLLQNQSFALPRINVWKHVSHWKPNAPSERLYQQATSLLLTMNNTTSPQLKQKEFMVVFGGKNLNDPCTSNTWIYDYKINSWTDVPSHSKSEHPSVSQGHSLVTLCNDTVILFGGLDAKTSSASNATWIYEAYDQTWTLISPTVSGGETIKARKFHSAVALKSVDSNCQCQESMYVFGGQIAEQMGTPEHFTTSELWELKCLSDDGQYEWVKKGQHLEHQTWPPPGQQFLAASNPTRSTMYVYGGINSTDDFMHKLWSLTVSSNGDVEWEVIQAEPQGKSFPPDRRGLTANYMTIGGTDNYFVLCCPIHAFSFRDMELKWIEPPVKYESVTPPVPRLSYPSSAILNGQLLVFGGILFDTAVPINKLWNLTLVTDKVWLWEQRLSPLAGPLRGRGAMATDIDLAHRKVYVYGGLLLDSFDSDFTLSDRTIWTLDIEEMKWRASLMPPSPPPLFGQTGIALKGRFVVFGGQSGYRGSLSNKTWIFDTATNQWTGCQWGSKDLQKRLWHSAVRTQNSSSMIIFGGRTHRKNGDQWTVLNDTWQFTMTPDGKVGNCRGQYHWTQLTWNLTGRPPPARFGHSAVVINNTMLVYGGTDDVKEQRTNTYKTCYNDVWMYDITNHKWTLVIPNTNTKKGNTRTGKCLHAAAIVGNKMIVAGGCSSIKSAVWNGQQLCACDSEEQTTSTDIWAFTLNLTSKTILQWERLTTNSHIDGYFIASAFLPWERRTLSLLGGFPVAAQQADYFYGSTTRAISIIRPGCNLGTFSRNFLLEQCQHCPPRQYPNSTRQSCDTCPQGLTIPKNNKPVIDHTNCSDCINSSSYCQGGTCKAMKASDGSVWASCSCPFGFTEVLGDDTSVCQPIYLAEAVGAIVAVVVAICLIIMAVRIVKGHVRNALKTKEAELRELANIWVIDSHELKLLERIDSNCPGGFGDVYKAEYREFTVAVKKLQQLQRVDQIEQEFEREIQFMRTVRHPNIVLFLGGGKFHDDGCPFLVLEYMSEGSLGAILRDDSIPIADDLKLRFTLDAAKGMRFLHNLTPPRVHRDLKSANLLVSKRWVIKVADFGSARLIREDRPLDDTASGEFSSVADTAPLLQPDLGLSVGVGTAQWSAPELLLGQIYGRPVDVYRYVPTKWTSWCCLVVSC